MTKQQLEQIDKYHSGRMSESEMASFEKQLESDPALKAESDLQSDIVGGLKEYRKLELKARLDAINVGPTWMEFMGQSALMKSMGGVIVASLIGTGIYLYGEQDEQVESGATVTINAPVAESIEYIWELGQEEHDNSTNTTLEKPEIANEPAMETNPEVQVADQSAREEQVVINEDKEVFKPSFEAPDVTNVEEDSKFQSAGLDELPETTNATASEDPIDVETENNRSKTIKYKYYDGKLFLSGDFDKSTYEILEINSASGRRIYVYYIDTYYKVGTTDRLTELPAVKDQDVIKELELLRENK
ncbi:hypothetical protein AAOE16_04535 [Ekhidna sp. MALMAid0563]|uniref:hypothetical protein n=1 Tax=Ekhidna sp. MALMAid0563 TaxID=3143937 RepID=UPI0032DEE8BD